MMSFAVRVILNALALWLVSRLVHGVQFVGGATPMQKVGIVLAVALIFGLVNTIIRPIVRFLATPLYIVTLGLFHFVVNAAMLWLTAWITQRWLHWGLHIDHFWPTAIWAAVVLSVVGWVLGLLFGRRLTRAR